ncbi:MAG: hypothetical protein LBS19_11140 [Clostridiales bacterium]|jgi:polyhydroxyalkanoate synthesis regulator phasin|nr:hypothetical protein [Clostridiales bacterium]
MKEEIAKILKMVEEGKITADEAVKLMEALHDSFAFDDYVNSDFNDKMRRFGKDAETFLKGVGAKMNGFVKDMEPKVRNVTKTVVARTAGIVEELGKALNDILDSMGNVCAGPECKDAGCCEEEAGAEVKEEAAAPEPEEESREN